MNNRIRNNLFAYIKKHCGDDLRRRIETYGTGGEAEFLLDLERACDVINLLKVDDFYDIYKDLRDDKPFARGIAVCEEYISGGVFTLTDIEENKGTAFAAEEFVEKWAEKTLKNPYYVDLFSSCMTLGNGAVNEKGELSGIQFTSGTSTYLLVTPEFEFHTLVACEIHCTLSDGYDLYVYKSTCIDDCLSSFDTLEELLYELMSLEQAGIYISQ